MVILGTPGLKQKKRVSWSRAHPHRPLPISLCPNPKNDDKCRFYAEPPPYQSSRGSPILWTYLIVCPSSGWGTSARDRDSQGQTKEHAPSLIANFRCLWTLVTSITVRRLLRFLDVANLPDKRRSLGERATCALHCSVSAGYEPAHIEVADHEVQLGTTRDARRCSTLEHSLLVVPTA